mmetsp:Transcript_11045/g.40877  ORF Transcript_11045/g.40877 Transcript_11045/m.40877 type:complete len:183 (-) Transcript_11045:1911-2459(-)
MPAWKRVYALSTGASLGSFEAAASTTAPPRCLPERAFGGRLERNSVDRAARFHRASSGTTDPGNTERPLVVAPVRARAAALACTRSDGVTQLMYLNRHATRLYKAARTGVRQAGGWEADFSILSRIKLQRKRRFAAFDCKRGDRQTKRHETKRRFASHLILLTPRACVPAPPAPRRYRKALP